MTAFSIRGLLIAASLALAVPAGAETLTLSTPDADTSEITLAANHFAELVKQKTKGELEIKVFPNGTLYGGDPAAGVKQLASGSLDMLFNATSLYATFNPKFTAIAVPYLFDDVEQLRAYLNSPLGEELRGDLSKIGIMGLDLWSRPLRQITNSKLPITKPDDLKGLKLRVPNNPLWVKFFGAMGAAPTPMAFAEVYNALQLGVVDGQENPVNVPVSARLYEVQKYLTISNHIADAWVVGINPRRYQALPEAFKTALNQAAVETEEWKAKNDAADIAKSIATLEQNGMKMNELTAEQRAAFVAVSKSLYPVFQGLVKDPSFFDRTTAFTGKS
ncbi:DctP family TRAP transporter solute-binding subunit [Ancylobacter defluvii]|uniref:ABC transporter substrate-binding protein n=1 Tax=Ancylobacter defluvii TaxID=1282440 RepID=A0A9W6NCQ7_9HYPH|nr:DctP family TRAP transporter solute-binding subunit [Ancylobacter defluvii]MBS7586612.1 DctP family TRAP transporter solute-binding subunit [Ancylobacter defluvii]GLK85902.1 ABC transporter substrate-binding protein [Ancylobacter defluvii]